MIMIMHNTMYNNNDVINDDNDSDSDDNDDSSSALNKQYIMKHILFKQKRTMNNHTYIN